MNELPEIVLEMIEVSFNSIFNSIEPNSQSLALMMLGWGYSDAAFLHPEFKKFQELADLFRDQVYAREALVNEYYPYISEEEA